MHACNDTVWLCNWVQGCVITIDREQRVRELTVVTGPCRGVKWLDGVCSTHLLLSPSDRERQSTTPPRMHSAEPAQPMNRAAPSSYLVWTQYCYSFITMFYVSFQSLNLLKVFPAALQTLLTFVQHTWGRKTLRLSCWHTGSMLSKSTDLWRQTKHL